MRGSEALVCLPAPQGLWAVTSTQGRVQWPKRGDNRGGDKWKLSASTPKFVGIRTKHLVLILVPPATNNNGPNTKTQAPLWSAVC